MIDIHALFDTLIARTQHWLGATDFIGLALRSALGLAAGAIVFFGLRVTLRLASARLSRAGTGAGEAPLPHAEILRTLGRTIGRTSLLFVLATALVVGAGMLPLPPGIQNFLHSVFIAVFVIQVAIWGAVVVTAWLEGFSAGTGEDRHALASATSLIGTLARVALWGIAAILILDNLGFNVSALIAGLGIGGIAIGLAAQKILGDLFASLAILLDKPFEYGDFIVAGPQMGTIERIGLKTTRLRSISGEQLVIANSDLLESRIQNFKRMGERRVLFKFGVVYGTPMEKLETIPGIIRAAVEAEPKVRFDRSHLASFDPMQVTFESVYYVLSSDFRTYMEVQQKVLLTLYQRLGAEGIRFALPGGNAAEPVQPVRS